MPVTQILYLHGFLSSPQSRKAQQTLAFAHRLGLAGQLMIPVLHRGPAATIAGLQQQIERALQDGPVALMGSSLGGYYATWLGEHYRLPAVLINPAVQPHAVWHRYLGEHRNYHSDQTHIVTESDIEDLRRLHLDTLQQRENYLVFQQQQDEVLDYRLALEKFGESRVILRHDGDHSYAGFAAELPRAFAFLLSRIYRGER